MLETEPQRTEQPKEFKDVNEEFREGGKGWLVVIGCGLGSFMGFGMINTYGAFQTHYKNVLYPNVPSRQLSMIGACQASFLYFGFCWFLPLAHAFGIRQFLTMGCSLMVIGLFLLSTATETSIWKAYVFQGVIYSIGSSMVFVGVLKTPFEWFKRKRATAFGINFACVSLGGVVWPLVFKKMIDKQGFKWTVLTIAFMYIPLSIAVILLIPQKLPEKYINESEIISNSKWDNNKIKNLPNSFINIIKDWNLVIKDWKFILVLFSNLLGAFGMFPAIFYLDFFGNLIAPNHTVTTYLVVIYNAFGGPGRIIPAMLADKFGRTNIFIIWIFLSGVSIMAIWIPSISESSTGLYLAFVILFGFFAGPYFSLMPAIIGQLFDIEGAPARYGLYLITTTPGPLLGCLIAGSFVPVDASDGQLLLDSFYKLTTYSGITIIASSLVLLIVRLSVSRRLFAFV